MSISFPYGKKLIKVGFIPDPTIGLPVKTIYGVRNLDFLVDSGADTTTLPLELAVDFGFRKSKGLREWISGVEGRKIASYGSKIDIGFGGKFYPVRCFFIDSKVTPLLGRLDVWDKFTIIFDNMKEEVVFEEIVNDDYRRLAQWEIDST